MTLRRTNRKYRNVVRAVYDTVWAIEEQKLRAITELLDMRSLGIRFSRSEVQSRINGRDRTPLEGAGQVAVLSVFGVLSHRMGMMQEISGGTSMEALASAIDSAASSDDVSAIVLNMDSEGGSVSMVEETAARILAARENKRVYAVVNSLAASGAYWLAAASDEIWITPSGQVGSIGVLTVHTDTRAAQKKSGIKNNIIRIPDTKAEGAGGEPLSDAAFEARMALVRSYYETFAGFVAQQRGVSLETIRRDFGRVYGAQRAVDLGMVDHVGTLGELLSKLGIGRDSSEPLAQNHRPAFSMEGISMNPDIFGALVRIGMCGITASEDEANQALARFYAAIGAEMPESDEAIVASLKEHIKAGQKPAEPAALVPATIETTLDPIVSSDSDRTAQIMAAVKLAALPADVDRLELAQKLIGSKTSIQGCLDEIGELVAKNTPAVSPTIVPGESQAEKFHAQAKDAILLRAFNGRKPSKIWSSVAQDYVEWKPSQAAAQNRSLRSLSRLAEKCMIEGGYDRDRVMNLEPMNVALLALGLRDPNQFGLFAHSDGPAYNVSGMFSNILLDASNVMLRDSYREAPTTFETWARQGESLPDFKQVNKVIGGELPDPKAIPEDGEFEETTYADGKESYKLTVWGEIFSISWQSVVNDQLGEFVSIPQKQGRAMKRKQNKLVYGILTDNAALSDGTALFAAGHSNNDTGVVTNYTTEFNQMRQKLAEQSGITSGTTLNIDPKFLLFPPAIEGDILQLLASSANPYAGTSTSNTGHSGVANIWRGRLQPVTDAQLGATGGGTDTNFFMAADPSDVDTVEYAYLQGLETPALDRVEAFDRLAVRFRIYQAFASKALDYRGLQRHTGAA